MNRKQPNPLVFAALAGVALFASTGVCYWQWNVSQDLSAEVQTRRVEVGSKTELERQLAETNRQLQEASSTIHHLESSITTIEYIPTLLKDLQVTGEACQLQILGVRPVPKVDNKPKRVNDGSEEPAEKPKRKPYEELDVEVKSRGTFDQLMTFLQRLETFPKIVAVKSMSLVPKTGMDGKSLDAIEASFRIRVYVFAGDKKNAPGTPSPMTAEVTTTGGLH